MQYWWVNHSQTGRHEIQGGYLWSPKRKTNGAFNQFYENMRSARPGDAVLSFINSQVGYVGIVSGRAWEEGKPKEFGTAGLVWNEDGWWVPVEWSKLAQPVRVKPLISEVRPLLPTRHSPISSSGDGNQGAYLAAISEDLFAYVIEQSGTQNWASSIVDQCNIPVAGGVEDTHLGFEAGLSASEREQLVKARRGQGLFRFRVFQIEAACRLTGVSNPELLIASHIKPWRHCKTTNERLDGANGLVLTPHVDRLFDRGLISFSDTGDVLKSNWLAKDDLSRLGLGDACARNVGGFSAKQQAYLDYHRRTMFERAER